MMKAFQLIPILAIALLIPSFAEAKHSKRKKPRHRTEQTHHYRSTFWTSARDLRATQGRGHDRRGYNSNRNRHRGHQDRYDNNRGRSRRRGRRGVGFGGTIVIRF